MLKTTIAAGALLAMTASAFADDQETLRQAPPPAPYVKVSDALPLPEFIPGLGILYVDPDTLPAGPFLSFDRDGALSATVYMTPIEDLQNGTSFDDLGIGAHEVTSVDVHYNAGHPGVETPHAHVVLYHDADAKARLAE